MKAKRNNPAVSTWGSSGYIVVLPKGEVMPDETSETPSLAELLERAKDHVMSHEEKEAQRQSWVRGEMALSESEKGMTSVFPPVAAPLEGTLTAKQFYKEWLKTSWDQGRDDWHLYFAEAYAAAVSKASREETANLTMQLNNYKSACGSKTPAELLKFLHYQGARISELEQELARLEDAWMQDETIGVTNICGGRTTRTVSKT